MAKIIEFPFKQIDVSDKIENKIKAVLQSEGYDEDTIDFGVKKAKEIYEMVKTNKYSFSIKLPDSISHVEANNIKEQIEREIRQLINQAGEIITNLSSELVWTEIKLYLAKKGKANTI